MGAKVVVMSGSPGESLREGIVGAYKRREGDPSPKIAFISGNFNVIHPGHQRLFRLAAEIADIVVVGVHSDSRSGVMFPQKVRVEGIKELSVVDYVIPLKDGQLLEAILLLAPDFVVKGKEHEKAENEEKETVATYGGRLVFGSGDQKFSSIDLLRKDFENIQYSSIQMPEHFLKRHNFNLDDLRELVKKSRGLKVIVIGDTIVDEYITCEALGLSQEDPTIVVNPIHRIKFLGGAAIVAAHAAGLGADVHFFSVLGQDDNASYVANCLDRSRVRHTLLEDQGRPTTLKQRYRAGEKTLLRVNELSQRSIPSEVAEGILKRLKFPIQNCDLLVFSDFNYGCLPTSLVNEIKAFANANGVMTVADSQSSSQIGDISRFKGMTLVTPTEREARLGVSDFESGLVVLADSLIEKAQAESVFVTLGAEGLLIRSAVKKGFKTELMTDRLPAFNTAPRDPAGAGDSLLITASLALAVGGSIWQAAYLGSLAAAIQVGRVGNTPLTAEELMSELRAEFLRSGIAS